MGGFYPGNPGTQEKRGADLFSPLYFTGITGFPNLNMLAGVFEIQNS